MTRDCHEAERLGHEAELLGHEASVRGTSHEA
jgi:hypothetical protein